jgi:hypothetical protein
LEDPSGDSALTLYDSQTRSTRMAEAGVNIEVLYSDHDHQLILVVDDLARGREVSEAWARETQS